MPRAKLRMYRRRSGSNPREREALEIHCQNNEISISRLFTDLTKNKPQPGTPSSDHTRRSTLMSSRQKRKQARTNGSKAAGTKTPAGIQKSAANSLKHGLTGKAIVLTNESQQQLRRSPPHLRPRIPPRIRLEMDLIDQMVAAQWRLRRIWRMQTAALDLKMDQQEAESPKISHRSTRPPAPP